jgi:DNA-directed RNA polymerase delta subunit
MNHKITTEYFQQVSDDLLKSLDTRSKDIISRRFGLATDAKETLESIGESYGITRERVRQIEAQAKKTLATNLPLLKSVEELLETIFIAEGGIIPPERLALLVEERIGSGVKLAIALFYLELLPDYSFVSTDALFLPHWRRASGIPAQAELVVRAGNELLTKAGHPLEEDTFVAAIKQRVVSPLETRQLFAWLLASKGMRKNPFGQWGLVGWSEITPRGVGDKAYAVLRQHGKPAHFRDITKLINEALFDRKQANPQTVHNELIKDKRFVLVGRGLYGLIEWGYMPGTVADVLASVLHKSAKALTREELIEQVLAQRLVKKNTILLSLQDHRRFVKTSENKYTLKEKS